MTITGGATTANEGDTNTYTYTVSDPGDDTITVVECCGTNGNRTDTAAPNSFDCTFPDGPASSTVLVTANDEDPGAGNSDSRVVTIANVKPTVTITSLTGNSGTACLSGNTVTLGFSWTDPAGTNDTYGYDVNWGDGNHTIVAAVPGVVSPVSGLTHTYLAGGPYLISVTVNDSDPGAGTTTSASSSFSFLYTSTGILQPVNWTQGNQDPSIFKWGSTLPVKVQFFDCNGLIVSNLVVQASVLKLSGSTPNSGIDEVITNTNSPDSNGVMRWSAPQYIYNLATKSLSDSSATYRLTLTVQLTGQTVITTFGTKAK